MDSISIYGGYPLKGECAIQGSKNAVLPMLAATVMVPGTSVLHNCPRIADVGYMVKLLESIGCLVRWEADVISVDAGAVAGNELPREYVARMRSSVILMGAILGRLGEVRLGYPGGCVIGRRPIDMHLQALSNMGVELLEEGESLTARVKRLTGARIVLPFPSVGATENVLLAAATAEGVTVIENAAREPEIAALCDFLVQAGASLRREEAGGRIWIEGVESLKPCVCRVPPDRIVAGTYLFGCLAAGGEVFLRGAPDGQLQAPIELAARMGGIIRRDAEGLLVKAPERCQSPAYVRTEVYPGFPTDLQSPLMSALCLAQGECVMEEAIFENRFKMVEELTKMGADIQVSGGKARVRGGRMLHGELVKALELRGGAALVVAGLAAEGETVVENRHFIDRGYEDIAEDFRCLGGRI